MINRLSGHHIVCGCGRVGAEVVQELLRSGASVVVIENDTDQLKKEIEVLNVPFVIGDATEPNVMEEANIKTASSLVTCLPNDADNVYICLTAKSCRKDMYVITRANNKNAEEHLKKAGADRVIFPYRLAGYRMALHCVRRAVTQFLDNISDDFRFEEILVPEDSAVVGKMLKDSGIRQAANVIVVGVLGSDGIMRPNPSPSTVLSVNDTLVLLGSADQMQKAGKMVANNT